MDLDRPLAVREVVRVSLAISFLLALGLALFLAAWVVALVVFLDRPAAPEFHVGIFVSLIWALFSSWITRPGGYFDTFGRSGRKVPRATR